MRADESKKPKVFSDPVEAANWLTAWADSEQLSDAQLQRLQSYKEGKASEINSLLRSNELSPSVTNELLDSIEQIDEAIANSQVKSPIAVFRGVRRATGPFLPSTGDVYNDAAYTSTSLLESEANKFRGKYDKPKLLLEIRLLPGAIALPMDGYALTHNWKHRYQAEILLPRSLSLVVVETAELSDQTRFIMEVYAQENS